MEVYNFQGQTDSSVQRLRAGRAAYYATSRVARKEPWAIKSRRRQQILQVRKREMVLMVLMTMRRLLYAHRGCSDERGGLFLRGREGCNGYDHPLENRATIEMSNVTLKPERARANSPSAEAKRRPQGRHFRLKPYSCRLLIFLCPADRQVNILKSLSSVEMQQIFCHPQ